MANLAEQLRQEKRNGFYKIRDSIIEIITEQIKKGKRGIVISFESYAKDDEVEYHKYMREWYQVSENHRIPLIEYLKSEGFVVKQGPLYCENIEVTL